MVVSAIAMRPPNYKYAKEGRSLMATPGSAVGTREAPFVDCYKAASRSPLLGVSLALNWAAMTEHLRTPLLYAPPRLPSLFEAIKYLSFATIARNLPTQELATNFGVRQKD